MHWEASFNGGVVGGRLWDTKSPGLPGLHIEFVTFFSIFVSWQSAFSKSKYSLSELSEVSIGSVDLFLQLLGEFDFLAANEDLGASLEDSLRRALHVELEVSAVGTGISDEHVELDVRTEWNEALGWLALGVGVLVGWVLGSGSLEAHHGLAELDETSFRGITFAVSVDVEQSLFCCSESCLHFPIVCGCEINSLKGGNWHLLHSGVKHLGLVVTWVIVEDGVGSQDYGLDKSDESVLLRIKTELDLLIWLLLSLISLMSLKINRAVNGLSVEEHVGDSHPVLGQGSGLV